MFYWASSGGGLSEEVQPGWGVKIISLSIANLSGAIVTVNIIADGVRLVPEDMEIEADGIYEINRIIYLKSGATFSITASAGISSYVTLDNVEI